MSRQLNKKRSKNIHLSQLKVAVVLVGWLGVSGAAQAARALEVEYTGGGAIYSGRNDCSEDDMENFYIGECRTTDDAAEEQTIVVKKGTVAPIPNVIYGGTTVSGQAKNKTVRVIGHQDFSLKDVVGGYSESGKVTDNTIELNSEVGGINRAIGGHVYEGDAIANRVVLSEFKMSGEYSSAELIGGYVGELSINGDGDGESGESDVTDYQGGTAKDNEVVISASELEGTVVGGRTAWGDAVGNRVELINSTISGSVTGGESFNNGDAIGNRVILRQAPIVSGMILGGVASGGQSQDNVLEVHDPGAQAQNVGGFQEYHFLLPADVAADDVMLQLQDEEGTDLGKAQVGVAMQSGAGHQLVVGDSVSLIQNLAGGVSSDEVEQTQLTGYENIAMQYQFGLDRDEENLYAVLESIELTEQSVAPVEGRLAGLAMLSEAADLINTAGRTEAWSAARQTDTLAGFIVLNGGHSRYKTGSYIKLNSFNTLLGLSKRFQQADGEMLAGGFVEAGWGSHRSFNDFENYDVHGKGNTRYVGLGALFDKHWNSGLHVDGAVRVGRNKTSWNSNDLAINGRHGTHVSYSSRNTYLGAQLGVGYELPISQATSVDLDLRYFWTRVGSDNITIAGDRYHFNSMNSNRTRLGATLKHQFTEQVSGFAGLAWDREYSGKAYATVQSLRTATPTIKGNTGVLNVGLRMTPKAETGMSVELSAQGYTGRRRGASGTLGINWAF